MKCSLWKLLLAVYCVVLVFALAFILTKVHPDNVCVVQAGQPVPILMWTKFFNTELNLDLWMPKNCSVPCYVTYDRGVQCKAPIVLFHARDLQEFPKLYPLPSRYPGQLFGVFGAESPNNQLYTSDKSRVSKFDFTMTYNRHSDIMQPYGPSSNVFTKDYCIPISQRKPRAVWFVSNCQFVANNRMEFARELAELFPVDFYGSCFDKFPPELPRDQFESEAMKRFVGTYKFFLSFENTNCYDYITEKYFRTLESCAIPVVLGPPNGEDYEPMAETIILVDDKTPQEVAEEMKRINERDELFEHYVRWKDAPLGELNPFFASLYSRSAYGEAYCDLCQLAHRPQINLNRPIQSVRC